MIISHSECRLLSWAAAWAFPDGDLADWDAQQRISPSSSSGELPGTRREFDRAGGRLKVDAAQVGVQPAGSLPNLSVTSVQIVDSSANPILPTAGKAFWVRVNYAYANPLCTSYVIRRTVNGFTHTAPEINLGCGFSGTTFWLHFWGDGNGASDALTDGLLILRFLFGFGDTVLIDGVVAPDCTRCEVWNIETALSVLSAGAAATHPSPPQVQGSSG